MGGTFPSLSLVLPTLQDIHVGSRKSLRLGARFRTGQFDAPSLFAQCACAFDGCKCRSSCLHVLSLRGGGDADSACKTIGSGWEH